MNAWTKKKMKTEEALGIQLKQVNFFFFHHKLVNIAVK